MINIFSVTLIYVVLFMVSGTDIILFSFLTHWERMHAIYIKYLWFANEITYSGKPMFQIIAFELKESRNCSQIPVVEMLTKQIKRVICMGCVYIDQWKDWYIWIIYHIIYSFLLGEEKGSQICNSFINHDLVFIENHFTF